MQTSRATKLCRRRLLGGAAAGLTSAALAPFSPAGHAAGAITVDTIARNLRRVRGSGGNALVLSTDAGQVLVDSGAESDSADLLATLAELPGDGVTALFNTHWHPDQVGSNAALGARGARIIAHAKTRQRLRAGYYLPNEDRYIAPLPAAGQPTESFYVDGATRIGGIALEYACLIAAHTDGDIYVAIPELNVIAVGDVVAPERDPVFDWYGGGWLGGRVDALARLLELGDAGTQFVPSYGPIVARTEIQAEHDLMLELFERMVEHVRLGETPRDMLDLGLLDGLGREFDDPYRLLYDLQKGFWANHNKLMHDIV
jgi:glyoxylase-like metal-dependent hydrolase (beta-lactamase superfamily II)